MLWHQVDVLSLDVAAERGYIDEVILPQETRPKLISALRFLENKVDSNPKKKQEISPCDGRSRVYGHYSGIH